MEYIDFYKDSNIYKIINADVSNGMVSHAYMLMGKDERLLKEFAVLISKHILCNFSDKNLCERIDNGNFADLKIYPVDDKPISTDDAKEIIADSIQYPYEGDRKIYIFNNLDTATIAAQNKLLKTLEEPSSAVTFIITSTIPYNVLPTIRSRCKILKVEEPNRQDIVRYVFDITNDRQKSEDIADLSAGSLSTVHKLLNDNTYIQMQKSLINIIKNMNSSADLLFYSGEVMKYKDRLDDVFDEFLSLMRDLMVVKAGGSIAPLKKDLTLCANRYSSEAINKLSKEIVEANQRLKANCNPNGVVEHFLMKMLEVRTKWF